MEGRITRDELDKLWADPASWTVIAYRCPRDPRLFVPKRAPWLGWTVNFGHPYAWPAVFGSVALAVGPAFLLLLLGYYNPLAILLATAAAIALLIAGCVWEAGRDRS